MSAAIAIDFESYFSTKLKYGMKQLSPEQYVEHELFDAYLVAVCDGTTTWAGHPQEFNWSALEGKTLLSHNRRFDNTVYNELVKRKLVPKVNYAGWECTANLSSYLCNRRALDKAIEFLFGVKLDKSARTEADGKHWPNDFSEDERAKMLRYAPADALWCWKIWSKYSSQWPELERRLSNLTIDQGMRGIQLNASLLDEYLIQTHEMKLTTEKLLPWLSGAEDALDWTGFEKNLKPTSLKCIAEQCRRAGIPCPPVKANEGEEAYDEWETAYRATNPWISALSSWRSVNKLYKTFLLMKSRIRPDGTMPFSLKYFGAHTGRWSGDGKINLQNPRKKPVLANEAGLMETDENRIDAALKEKKRSGTLPDWVKYSIDFRALLIPRPGKIMVTCDLAQIEPRILAWLTGNTVLLDMIRGGLSVYEAFARANLGYTAPGKMDKDSDYYKLVKIMVLGLGYQAGWRKFITIAAAGGLDIVKDDPEFIESVNPHTGETKRISGYGKRSREVVADFREKSPKLLALWANLDNAFKRSLGSDFSMALPNGRRLNYRDVRASIKIVVDEETKKAKRTTIFTSESDGRRTDQYGGKLTENLVQATARDVFAEHLIALEDAGHKVLFSSHDEAVCECEPTTTAEEIQAIMSQCPAWAPGLPVAAEAKTVAHYTK
jgi:hypothetical protein